MLIQNGEEREGGHKRWTRIIEKGSFMICFISFHAKDLWTNGGHIPGSNQYEGVN